MEHSASSERIMDSNEERSVKRGLLPRFTLRDGDSFLLADALGDVHGCQDGFFTADTRMLSRFELAISGHLPSLLGGAVSQDNTLFTSHLTNRPLPATGEKEIPTGVIHIERRRVLWDQRLYEWIGLSNFGQHDTEVPLRFSFAADFADIFEVQGHPRRSHGVRLPPSVGTDSVLLPYRGCDGRERATCLVFAPEPRALTDMKAEFCVRVPRGTSEDVFVEIGHDRVDVPSQDRFMKAAKRAAASMRQRLTRGAGVTASGQLFSQWIDKSRADLALLTTDLPTGPYPYAGIPWFATQFGRDAIITALQTLWINPQLAAGVLRYLASTQAHVESSFRDSEPGKIMHETRRGEMAALGEVPFGRYYGGVDTTPLFVMLAGAYEKWTGDEGIVDEIWDAVLGAAGWIERRLAASRTGFLDYARGENSGLANQGWKDSQDSIFHADGRLPSGPLAVVEVQGYAYAAFAAMAGIFERRGRDEIAGIWRRTAERLRCAIEESFWIPDLNYYAIALDGDGELCRVRASNAGHLLFCGVPSVERGRLVCSHLLSRDFCSGWGIRTLAAEETRYNPMSYHNGSVWPHDTAICTAGIARYGQRDGAVRLLSDIFETAIHFELRLPELYCGFPRVPGQAPVPYPVACLPQAWASGTVFLLVQSVLGLEVSGSRREVHVTRPSLPEGIESLVLTGLPVGGETIDLVFRQVDETVVVAPTTPDGSAVRVITHH